MKTPSPFVMLVHTPTQTEVEEYTARMCGPLEPLPVAVVMGGPGAYVNWIAGIVMCSKCGTGHTRATGPQKQKEGARDV